MKTLLMLIAAVAIACDNKSTPGLGQAAQALVAAKARTISNVAPSSVFPPGRPGDKHLAMPVPSSQTVTEPGGYQAQIVELRGWLRRVGTSCNHPRSKLGNKPYADLDWHWDLELDPTWLDMSGIDINTLITIGSIHIAGWRPEGSNDPFVMVSPPLVHIELNGWQLQPTNGVPATATPGTPPSDWGFSQQADPSNCSDALWAYNPRNPLPFQAPLIEQLATNSSGTEVPAYTQYVRIVGSLVTDDPHLECYFLVGCINSTAEMPFWRGSFADSDPHNPTRWTEVHPPDIISIVNGPAVEKTETVRCAAVGAVSAIGTVKKTLDLDVFPPGQAPPGASIGYREAVDNRPGYTLLSSIVEGMDRDGDGTKDGATVSVFPDHVHLHVAVESKPFFGTTGKFKACYRVFWHT